MKENRDELGRNIRELRNELNQTLNYSIRNMQDTLHKNLLTGNEMQREKFEAMGKQQEAFVKSTEKRLDDMRQMVEEKLQKTLNERIGQSFEIVRSQLENVQKGLGEMKSLAQDIGGLKKVLSDVKTRGTFGEVQLGALLDQMLVRNNMRRMSKPRRMQRNLWNSPLNFRERKIVMILYIYLWMPNFPKMYMSNIRMHTKPEMPH